MAPVSRCRMRGSIGVVQLDDTRALVFSVLDGITAGPPRQQLVVSVPSSIQGVDACHGRALLWTSTRAYVFQLDDQQGGGGGDGNGMATPGPSLDVSENSVMVLHKDFIFQAADGVVKVLCRKGVVKSVLYIDDHQGHVICMDASDRFLCLLTTAGYIRRWSLENNEVTPSGPGCRCKIIPDSSLVTASLRCNADASKMSFLIKLTDEPLPSTAFVIYDAVLDKVLQHDLSSSNTTISSHCWDFIQSNFVAFETVQDECRLEIVSSFASYDYGAVEQSKLQCTGGSLLGVSIPFIYVFSRCHDNEDSVVITKTTMQLFEDMVSVDCRMQAALLRFNFNLLVGNILDAYKCVDFLNDSNLWEKLARFCVKSRFLDPALFCLAKVKTELGGTMITSFSENDTNEIKLAALAIQLGLLKEAEAIYVQCKRHDLLNSLQQMCLDWEQALSIASKKDSIHLKNTHHAYGKHLEGLGNYKEAIKHYELSDTYRFEVPRMLVSLHLTGELEAYVTKNKDPSLRRWWAHLCEVNDDLPKAIDYYTAAGDIASVVRVYSYLDEAQAAAEMALRYADSSAMFQLARQHEKNGCFREAMDLFTKAGKSDYAAKIAMKHAIGNELLSLSLQSSKETMLVSAKYFEEKAMHEEAVLLYKKGGNLARAVDVCIQSQLFDALKAIASELDEETDPELLSRCGDFLLSHNQMEKAMVLHIAAGHHDRALDLCIKEAVTLTDTIADQFTSRISSDDSRFKDLVTQLAECCEAQGSYHLACKKYTQAGDRIRGVRALIRSGDVERVILFANTSRQKELYVLCADYLQTLDWHDDLALMKTIVQMYTKAGETNLLAEFYVTCARIEIDEFRDYEKALGALKEAVKYARRKPSESKEDNKIEALTQHIAEVEKFVEIRRMCKTDPRGMILACTELLMQLDPQEAAVRVGDVYALLVEFYHSQGNMEQARSTLEKMRGRGIPIDLYVDQKIVDSI